MKRYRKKRPMSFRRPELVVAIMRANGTEVPRGNGGGRRPISFDQEAPGRMTSRERIEFRARKDWGEVKGFRVIDVTSSQTLIEGDFTDRKPVAAGEAFVLAPGAIKVGLS